ncbi:tyrosine-type recombinase/integrase [Halopseudomonas oceani]|uniref:tyrosine-type recombinase/integrase n=1 Tax=Halopseudomonas oceani TaxID=1708783 RepID=UPI002AA8FFB0|nr:tyrosine-type recombinase/integrase [Halopseudomonas oceani]
MQALPSYLQLSRHSVFYCRVAVPQSLRPVIGRREIRRSLNTRCRREALMRSHELLCKAQLLFAKAVAGKSPSPDTLKGSWSGAGESSNNWAAWLRQQRLLDTEATAVGEGPKGGGDAAKVSKSGAPKLSQVAAEMASLQEAQGVSFKSLDDKAAVVALFVEQAGDRPIDAYTRADALAFKQAAAKLPPHTSGQPRRKLSRGSTRTGKTISVTTLNNYIKWLASVFSFAVKAGYCSLNPFLGMKTVTRKKVSQERSVFTEADLRKLFQADTYASANDDRPHKYWLPLLGLYTGARLNELCQLYLDDVVTVNGIACLHIQDKRPDQRLKTPASERLLPIHPRLKALGFIEFIEKQRAAGHSRVFAELTRHSKHGYGHAPSKWFARMREALGFKEQGEKKDFHSFRHTVADHLKQKGIAESLVAGLLGHQSQGITFSRYGKDYRPETLLPVVEAITLESL